jgi:hypothetical protein
MVKLLNDIGREIGKAGRKIGQVAEEGVEAAGRTYQKGKKAAEQGIKDAGRLAQKGLKIIEKVATAAWEDGILKVTVKNPIAKGVINTAEDAVKRGFLLAQGRMNFDITGKNGPKIKQGIAGLKPGDIMLKQGNWGHSASTFIIGAGQVALNRSGHRYFGAVLLGHAAVYIGDGKIVEAGDPGVVVSYLDRANPKVKADYSHYNWYVVRCRDEAMAAAVAEAARQLVPSLDVASPLAPIVAYNKLGLAPATVVGTSGTLAAIDHARSDPTKEVSEMLKALKEGRSKDRPQMFCSELAVYCLNRATDSAGQPRLFKARQDRVSPEELYVWTRDKRSVFEYAGELPKGVR